MDQPVKREENPPPVVQRNIRALMEARRRVEQEASLLDRTANLLTAFSGSVLFVLLHLAWFGGWILLNAGILPIPAFDPFPFGLLTTIVSLEAIFLSTFVLISQNREAIISDRQAELDVQINLLAEHEITRLLTLVTAIAKRLEVDIDEGEMKELEQDVPPDALLRELERNGKP
jgi:uncharacterized membrane protein